MSLYSKQLLSPLIGPIVLRKIDMKMHATPIANTMSHRATLQRQAQAVGSGRSTKRTLQQNTEAVPRPDMSWALKAKVACAEVMTLSMSVEAQLVTQPAHKQVHRC